MSPEEVHDRLSQISRDEHHKLVNYIRTCQTEECVQHAYLEALLHAESIERPEKLKAWLMTDALRAARRQINDHSAEKRLIFRGTLGLVYAASYTAYGKGALP